MITHTTYKQLALVGTFFATLLFCCQVKAAINISPIRPGTNEAFDITVTGGFMYRNSVTGNTVSVTANHITINMYAPILEVFLWMPTEWQTTAHIPPLAAGDYLVTAVMNSGAPDDYLQTQSATIRIMRSPFIDTVTVDSSQPTYPPPLMNLAFKGSTTSVYSIQSSIDLLTWTNEYDSLHMTNVPHAITFPMTGTSRYYRVVEDADP